MTASNMKTVMCLRPFHAEDAARILKWCKDKHSFRLWSADRFRNYPATPEELIGQYEDGHKIPLVALMDGEVIGHLMLRYPSEDKTVVRFGFVIVDDTKRGMGYGKQMIRLAIEYAQKELGAKRITLGVFSDNHPALKCYQSIGFRITGEDAYMIDGKEWKGVEMEWS